MRKIVVDRLTLLGGGSLLALALVASPMTIEPGSLLPSQPEALAKSDNANGGKFKLALRELNYFCIEELQS